MLDRRTAVTVLASAAVALTGVTANAAHDEGSKNVRFNQIQFIGSHNAYHRELSETEKKLQLSLDPGSADLFYSHASIPDQLAQQNVRSVELDVFPTRRAGSTSGR